MEELQQEYKAWLKDNVPAKMLKEMGGSLCAWELMAYINNDDPQDNEGWQLTQAQYAWLANFCERWRKEERA